MRARAHFFLRSIAGLLVTVLFCLPLFWAVVASLRPAGLPPAATIEWWPQEPAWSNYREIFALLPLGHYIQNSLVVVAVAVPLTLLTASLAGFGIAHMRTPWRRRLLLLTVVLLMIPPLAVWHYRYHVLLWLGLVDSLGALIAPAAAGGTPLLVLLYYWAFRRIPEELYEAARLEGAGPWRLWWQIGRPLARPTTVGVAILAFVLFWSDFTGPVLYLYRPDLYTMPVALELLHQMNVTTEPLLMAAAVLMTLPVLLLVALLQHFFLRDLSLGRRPGWE